MNMKRFFAVLLIFLVAFGIAMQPAVALAAMPICVEIYTGSGDYVCTFCVLVNEDGTSSGYVTNC